jgi:hypothetical protein
MVAPHNFLEEDMAILLSAPELVSVSHEFRLRNAVLLFDRFWEFCESKNKNSQNRGGWNGGKSCGGVAVGWFRGGNHFECSENFRQEVLFAGNQSLPSDRDISSGSFSIADSREDG